MGCERMVGAIEHIPMGPCPMGIKGRSLYESPAKTLKRVILSETEQSGV